MAASPSISIAIIGSGGAGALTTGNFLLELAWRSSACPPVWLLGPSLQARCLVCHSLISNPRGALTDVKERQKNVF